MNNLKVHNLIVDWLQNMDLIKIVNRLRKRLTAKSQIQGSNQIMKKKLTKLLLKHNSNQNLRTTNKFFATIKFMKHT